MRLPSVLLAVACLSLFLSPAQASDLFFSQSFGVRSFGSPVVIQSAPVYSSPVVIRSAPVVIRSEPVFIRHSGSVFVQSNRSRRGGVTVFVNRGRNVRVLVR